MQISASRPLYVKNNFDASSEPDHKRFKYPAFSHPGYKSRLFADYARRVHDYENACCYTASCVARDQSAVSIARLDTKIDQIMSVVEKTNLDVIDMANSITNENAVLDTNNDEIKSESISPSITIETKHKKHKPMWSMFLRHSGIKLIVICM